MDASTWYLTAFVILWLVRYFRLIINIFAFCRFGPRPLSPKPRFSPEDVTAVVSTVYGEPKEVMNTFRRILQNGPAQLITVTHDSNVTTVQRHCRLQGFDNVKVLGVPKLNKRLQMLTALKHVNTSITVFADDDVDWQHSGFLWRLLACFEDSRVGGAGPRQRTRREASPSMWNFLGISYLERRNFNTGATNYLDGGISTLSGRTQAVRTEILKSSDFFFYFQNDHFMGRKLMVDDDKALTRYIYANGWKIALNFDSLCTIETTQEDSLKFLNQCTRWARGHWRGNLIVMAKETYWFNTHLWTLYAIYFSQFQTPAFAMDGLLAWSLYSAMNPYSFGLSPYTPSTRSNVYLGFALWVFFTKLVKLIPHFYRYPSDLKFVPLSIAFSYLHGIINLYALFTTHQTVWGGRHVGSDSGPQQQITL